MNVAKGLKTVGVLGANLPSMASSCAARFRRNLPLLRKLRPYPALWSHLAVESRHRAHRALIGVGASFALATLAVAPEAQAQKAVTGDFAVQRFDPAAGPHNYFTTRGVRMDGK